MREIHKGHRALSLKPLEQRLYIDTLDDMDYIAKQVHKWTDYHSRELRILFPISYPNIIK